MKEELRTTDLWLAGFLLAKGAELTHLDKNPDRPGQTVVILSGENLKENAKTFTLNADIPILSFKQLFLDLKHSLYRRNLNNITRGNTNESERTSKA